MSNFLALQGFLSFVCLLSWIGKTLQNFLLPQIEILTWYIYTEDI